MKKLILLLILAICINNFFAQEINQYEIPFLCSKAKTGHIHNKQAEIIEVNALLLDYDVTFYFLDLNVSNYNDLVSGNVQMKAKVVSDSLRRIILQLIDQLVVDSVWVNNESAIFTHSGNEISINLDEAIGKDEFFTTNVFYHGQTGDGFMNEIDENWGFNVTYNLSENLHAKEWWPCKEVLEDKADSAYIFITTPNGQMAGSNGILGSTSYFANGDVRYEWKTRYPIAFYLISVAVSDYYEYSYYFDLDGSDKPMLVQNFIYNNPNVLATYKNDIDLTANMIVDFSEKMGIYPFYKEKYGHCQWSWGGAMEHQTMTSTRHFSFSLVAHELAHQWFGDNVTCATWNDIWINEGFASYGEYIALQDIAGQEYADEQMAYAHNYALTAQIGSVYVPDDQVDDEDRVFDWYLTYRKGMAIIHMIRFELDNDSLFFASLKNFQQEFGGKVASGLDFKNSLEQTSGMDFTDFFNQWYFGEGYPIFDVSFNWQNDTLYLRSVQTTSAPSTLLFKTSMEYDIYAGNTVSRLRLNQETNDTVYSIYFNSSVDSVILDPDNWVLNDVPLANKKNKPVKAKNKFLIYPNPVKDNLMINSDKRSEVIKVEIYNSIQQLVFTKLINEETPVYLVNIKPLKAGIYFMVIYDRTGHEVKKILIE